MVMNTGLIYVNARLWLCDVLQELTV